MFIEKPHRTDTCGQLGRAKYETTLYSSYKPWIKAKAFCLYSKQDYNELMIKQKKKLQRHHAKEIDIIVNQ
ncbi:MAG TPA: hypothetical protein VH500_03115 [Nitrososphaeraceae archaeon]|jgi:hypothetical protein